MHGLVHVIGGKNKSAHSSKPAPVCTSRSSRMNVIVLGVMEE